MSFQDIKKAHRVREGYWFAPKMFGLGATPVTWQGWLMTAAFCAALFLTIRFLPGEIPKIVVGVVLVVLFSVFAMRKTDGGWSWHWGPGDR